MRESVAVNRFVIITVEVLRTTPRRPVPAILEVGATLNPDVRPNRVKAI